MTMQRLIMAIIAAFALAPLSAQAQAVEEKNVLSGKTKLDPALGYLFVQASSRSQGVFLRVPDDATRDEYQKDWDEGFAKAKKKYQSALKTWENDVVIAKSTKAKLPPRPEEPARESFSIGAIELRDMIGYGPMFVFSKSETQFTYLTAVKPGTYIYYGPMFYAAGLVPTGICYCMGTVKFDVKSGIVTDLGNSLIAAPRIAPPYDVQVQAMLKMAEERRAKGKEAYMPPTEVLYGVPASLSALPSVRAELQASGKLNNYFGTVLSRLPPIPGVLGYRRDTVLDLRTGSDVPNPPIRTQVRIKK